MTEHHDARHGPGQRRSWIPDVLADRYEIDRELGSGAAAVTVAAQDRRLGRRVAIKILKPESELDQEFSRRFTREARAAAAINHPNIVSVYDVGEEGDLLYLVMQFVDGTDLKRLIERQGALPWRRAVAIARDVLAGLAPIHEAGIVHRDIKPQNVLIGKDGEVKVADFGVAHIEMDAALTTAGTTVGTASYMAPEQAQGQMPTPAADVYAVGVMLYEMVTGRLPFNEATSIATMLAHIQQEAKPPVAPRGMDTLPVGVTAVIRQAMMKDPTKRFRTATAMRRALEHQESTQGAAAATAASSRTEVVPSLRQPARPPRRGPAAAPRQAPPRDEASPVERAGGGFGATVVMILLILAIALVAVAGVLWFLEERPNLLAGGDGEQPTATIAAPTPTPTSEPEAPAVIEPIATDEPEPSPTPTPVPPTPTPVPLPTEQIIVPAEPTDLPPTLPSTDPQEGQIIEPIEDSTVPVEPPG